MPLKFWSKDYIYNVDIFYIFIQHLTCISDSARCSQTGVFRVHLEDDLMDDSRLIIEVDKTKVIYDPKNVMYKDLQAKEKAWDAVD